MLATSISVCVEACDLKSDPDLATFLEGLKAVEPQAAPKRREVAIRGTFELPKVDAAGTFRYVIAATFATIVFFGTVVGLVKFFHLP
jgi:hypothetical protein